jgi:hypothetical protein
MVSGSCALPTRWPPQCSCIVIESSFDPGERLQAPGSLWFIFSLYFQYLLCMHTAMNKRLYKWESWFLGYFSSKKTRNKKTTILLTDVG